MFLGLQFGSCSRKTLQLFMVLASRRPWFHSLTINILQHLHKFSPLSTTTTKKKKHFLLWNTCQIKPCRKWELNYQIKCGIRTMMEPCNLENASHAHGMWPSANTLQSVKVMLILRLSSNVHFFFTNPQTPHMPLNLFEVRLDIIRIKKR